jgi:hypothetical protein
MSARGTFGFPNPTGMRLSSLLGACPSFGNPHFRNRHP